MEHQEQSRQNIVAIICEIYPFELFVLNNRICCKWLHVLRQSGDDEDRAQEDKVSQIHNSWIRVVDANRPIWDDLINALTNQTAAIGRLADAKTKYRMNVDLMLAGTISHQFFKSIIAAEYDLALLSKSNADVRFEAAKNTMLKELLKNVNNNVCA